MEQYNEMKAKHPDAILLYRVGDFYETFGEDAIKASQVLGITLTSRNNGGSDIELAGFPYHSVDAYLPKLVRAGYRVAICEQLEKPSKGKKIVKRGITDVVTPGVTLDNHLLDHKKNNFLAAISFGNDQNIGIALADVSTGEFYAAEGHSEYINKVLQSFSPSEIVLARSTKNRYTEFIGDKYYTYFLEDWIFTDSYAQKKLLSHFDVTSLKGFGIHDYHNGMIAAGSILHYLESTENHNPRHLSKISRLNHDDFLWMDRFTIRNLELINAMSPEGKSLFDVLDHSSTPMGSRLLRKWIIMPLVQLKAIQHRLDAVEELIHFHESESDLSLLLKSIGDLERLVSKIPLFRISPRELKQLEKSLEKIEQVKSALIQVHSTYLKKLIDTLNPCQELRNRIHTQIDENAPNSYSKGGIFKEGVNQELDELKYVLNNSKDLLLNIQKEEAINTGISNLKIGFNSVFGYYLEVTNKYKNQDMVPAHWIRKQTMSTGERYVTDELKKLESKILGAEEKILQIEEDLFKNFITDIQDFLPQLQQNAQNIARLDVLHCLAKVATLNQYNKPSLNEDTNLDIKAGRHPVIEKLLPQSESYIPNDLHLNSEDQQIIMITGPNMSGKSAILRQTAVICIMAQMGSYVPAESASIGIIDRVYTRVGASDNISSGESTFMVEMNETASILNNLSSRSLILLDEIGRGTSTYDGISIAWSIAEYLHTSKFRPKTLFATHYHELNELSSFLPRIKNFHVSTMEMDKTVIFLRKLVSGGSEHSFGIHVARMAGMPDEIIKNAGKKLKLLEAQRDNQIHLTIEPDSREDVKSENESLTREILSIDTQSLSPIEALLKIHELQNSLRKKS
ncbi:MAG: DNA mismatch repair protein MutS [Saprospiraceae bacterium]|nr:DNA mismatch repair protein MutS [Saprospiraceae bacterium]